MGYDICSQCAKPVHRCECRDRQYVPAGAKESYTAAEFTACLHLVARPGGLLLGAVKAVIQAAGTGHPLTPDMVDWLRRCYDDSVDAMRVAFGRDTEFAKQIVSGELARSFWDLPESWPKEG